MKTCLLGFCIGALCASTQLSWLFLFLPFVFIYVAAFYQKTYLACLCLAVGSAWVLLHLASAQSNALPIVEGVKHQTIKSLLVGSVGDVSVTDQKTSFSFNFYQNEHEVESDRHASLQGKSGKLKVSCYRCKLLLKNGEHWQLALRIKPVVSLQNLNGFDYRKWMTAKGFIASGSVVNKSPENIKLKEGGWRLEKLNFTVAAKTKYAYFEGIITRR